jgi:hypothetical protein
VIGYKRNNDPPPTTQRCTDSISSAPKADGVGRVQSPSLFRSAVALAITRICAGASVTAVKRLRNGSTTKPSLRRIPTKGAYRPSTVWKLLCASSSSTRGPLPASNAAEGKAGAKSVSATWGGAARGANAAYRKAPGPMRQSDTRVRNPWHQGTVSCCIPRQRKPAISTFALTRGRSQRRHGRRVQRAVRPIARHLLRGSSGSRAMSIRAKFFDPKLVNSNVP